MSAPALSYIVGALGDLRRGIEHCSVGEVKMEISIDTMTFDGLSAYVRTACIYPSDRFLPPDTFELGGILFRRKPGML